MLAISTGYGQGGFVFGIKPGNTINSASFGIKMGNLVPTIGADLIWITASGTYTDENYSSYYGWSGDYYEYRSIDEDDVSGSAFLLIPSIGMKMYMGDKSVRPYLLGNIFFSLPFVSAESESRYESWEYINGELEWHYIDIDDDDLDKEDEELIEDALGFWGVTLGGGAEYFFSEHFSVGGEYGLRLVFGGVEASDEDRSSYGDEEYVDAFSTEVSASVRVTYAVISLNYHF
jgi:hypothetical protein